MDIKENLKFTVPRDIDFTEKNEKLKSDFMEIKEKYEKFKG
jgi:hypothetical protein